MTEPALNSLTALRAKVEAAVQAEEQYDRINSTKLRAIHEAESYDAFHNMVLASNLKPVNLKVCSALMINAHNESQESPIDQLAKRKPKETQLSEDGAPVSLSESSASVAAAAAGSVSDARAWQSQLREAKKSRENTERLLSADGSVESLKLAATAEDFERDWDRHCQTQPTRAAYLRRFDRVAVGAVCASNLGLVLPGQIVVTLGEMLAANSSPSGDTQIAFWWLCGLSRMPGFSTFAATASDQEKSHIGSIFKHLTAHAPAASVVESKAANATSAADGTIAESNAAAETRSSEQSASSTKPKGNKAKSRAAAMSNPMMLPGWQEFDSSASVKRKAGDPAAKSSKAKSKPKTSASSAEDLSLMFDVSTVARLSKLFSVGS